MLSGFRTGVLSFNTGYYTVTVSESLTDACFVCVISSSPAMICPSITHGRFRRVGPGFCRKENERINQDYMEGLCREMDISAAGKSIGWGMCQNRGLG